MEDILSYNNLTAQFISEPAHWRVFAKWGEVADVRPEDWSNENIDFRSKEAGLALLSALDEVYDIVTTASDEVTAEMAKNDLGVTKNIPDASADDMHPELSVETGETDAEEVLQLIKDILDDAEANGCEPEHLESIASLEEIYHSATKNLKPRPVKFNDGGDKTCTKCNVKEKHHFIDKNEIVGGVHCTKDTIFE